MRIKDLLVLPLCAMVAATALVTGTAQAASADSSVRPQGVATNYRNDYLTDSPNTTMETARVHRNIILAAGNYNWYFTVERIGNPGRHYVAARSIYLAAGTYSWECNLDPGNMNYVGTCTLSSATGYARVGPGNWLPADTAVYQWGGLLESQ